jgi:predicted transcriptional regulator
MTKYRHRVDIIANILEGAKSNTKKTKIMYMANLSYGLFKKYLDETLRLHFLHFDGEVYGITSKGQAFLDKYAAFSEKYSPVVKSVEAMESEWKCLEEMCSIDQHADARVVKRRRGKV